jgi:S1-C subfamily serine protease
MVLASAASLAVSIVVAVSPQAVQSGTGFAVKSDSRATQIVTAAHVVENASRVVVILQDGSDYTATVLARDRVRDAALLSVDIGGQQTLTLAAQPPAQSDPITVIGFPGAHKFSVNGDDMRVIGSSSPTIVNGEVEAVQQRGESVVFKADVGHGDSGAPILDRATNSVVGMTTGSFLAAGIMLAYNGMDLGLSSAGLSAVLHPAMPASGAHAPQFVVAVAPAAALTPQSSIAAFVHSTFVQNSADQADFIGVDAPWAKDPAAICHAANAHAVALVSASADGALVAAGLTITDCIGNPYFAESQSLLADEATYESEKMQAGLLTAQLAAEFNGWVDGARGPWLSLLRYGIAIAPDDLHYYSLLRLGDGELNANRVAAVMPGGPAAVAGLRRGDVIVTIDGASAADMTQADVFSALDRSTVALMVQRGSGKRALTLKPRRFPELVRMLGYTQ